MFKTAAKKKSQGTLNIQHARLTSMARNRYCTEPRQKLSSEERNKLTLRKGVSTIMLALTLKTIFSMEIYTINGDTPRKIGSYFTLIFFTALQEE